MDIVHKATVPGDGPYEVFVVLCPKNDCLQLRFDCLNNQTGIHEVCRHVSATLSTEASDTLQKRRCSEKSGCHNNNRRYVDTIQDLARSLSSA